MSKKMTLLLLVAATLVMTTGCSLFAKDGGKDKAANGVKITDDFTHEDPDIDFDQRKVLEFTADNDYVQAMNEQLGVDATRDVTIFYGKEGTPVVYYEYVVLSDEEQAATYEQFAKDNGMEVTVNGNVVCHEKSGDALEAEMAMYMSYNMLAEETVDAYVDFYVNSFGPTVLE